MVGWSDVPADTSNTFAFRLLAAQLPDAPVVTSGMLRTRQTAEALDSPGDRLPDEPGLREIHFGDWELKTFDEVSAASPEHIRAFWDRPGDIAPPNGESWNSFAERVDAATDRLVDLGLPDLIVICHFGVILRHIERALDIPTIEAFSHRIDNLSLTEIEVSPQGWTAHRINHIP
jgi:broad specificity phosphatase PhoE